MTRRILLTFLVLALLLVALRPAAAQKKAKVAADAVQIAYVTADEVKLPPDFQVALYENLIEEVKKTGRFKQVFRDGEQGADAVKDLVVLHSTVTGFKQGSAMARQVTTVAGATKIRVRVQMTTRDGRIIFDRDVEGSVRFFGENLRATYDFAKDVAKLVKQNF